MIRLRMMAWFYSQLKVAVASSAQEGATLRTEASQVEEAGVDQQVQRHRRTHSETQTCKGSPPLERAMECILTFITSRGQRFK